MGGSCSSPSSDAMVATESQTNQPTEEERGEMPPIVWVLGGPGSGKGTQCDLIVERLGFTHISSGDLLRAEARSGSDRGRQLNQIMEMGDLVPLETVLRLLEEAMAAARSTSKGFLVDGFPRDLEQADQFEQHIGPCTRILYFEVSDETMRARLLKRGLTSGRVDDNEETIQRRIQTFHRASEPVIAAYEDRCVRINAENTVEEIYDEACSALQDI